MALGLACATVPLPKPLDGHRGRWGAHRGHSPEGVLIRCLQADQLPQESIHEAVLPGLLWSLALSGWEGEVLA